jgi:hypothetical protein
VKINQQDDVRQLRFRENLRWFLRNEAMLKCRKEQGYLDAQYIFEIFNEVSAAFAEARIDTFNEVIECYQAGGLNHPIYSEGRGIILSNIVEVIKLPWRTPAAPYLM